MLITAMLLAPLLALILTTTQSEIAVASPDTFGYETEGTLGLTDAYNRISGSVFTCSSGGTADNISVYLADYGGFSKKCAIYKHSDSTLVTNGTTEVNTSPYYSEQWVTFDFAGTVTLEAGTDYVLVFWSNGAGDVEFYYDDGDDTTQGHYQSLTYGTWPTTANFSHDDKKYSIYCSYTLGAQPVKPTEPILYKPIENGIEVSQTPTFEWTCGENADNHRLLVDNDNDVSSPIDNILLSATDNTWTKQWEEYSENTIYWKVIAINENGENSSDIWQFSTVKTFGYEGIGENWQDFDDRIVGSVFTTPNRSVTAKSISVYLREEPQADINAAIYRENDNSLISSTGSQMVVEATAVGIRWETLEFEYPYSTLEANTEYILVIWGNKKVPEDYLDIAYTSGTPNQGRYQVYGWENENFPSPADFTYEDRKYSIYCTFTSLPFVETQDATGIGIDNAVLNARINYGVSPYNEDNVDIRFRYKDFNQCFTEPEATGWSLSDWEYSVPTDPATADDWAHRGDNATETLKPNENGVTMEWYLTDSTHYGATSDVPDSTFIYFASDPGFKDILGIDNAAFSTEQDNILSVRVRVRCRVVDGGGDSENVRLIMRTHDTNYYVDNSKTVTRDAFTWIEGTAQENNPNTGSPWTFDEINDLQVGLETQALGLNEIIRCSKIDVVVNYDRRPWYIAASDSSAEDKAAADVVCDGDNDQVQINAALNSDNAVVYLFDGNYYGHTTYAFSFTRDSITLLGESKENTIIHAIDHGTNIDKSNLLLENFTIRGAGRIYPGESNGIYQTLAGAGSQVYRNLKIENFTAIGIYILASAGNIWVLDSEIRECGDGGIAFCQMSTEDGYFAFNNEISGILGSYSYPGGHGIVFAQGTYHNSIVANNVIENCAGAGISVWNETDNMLFQGNKIVNSGVFNREVYAIDASKADNSTIQGNLVKALFGLKILTGENNHIENNNFYNTGSAWTDTGSLNYFVYNIESRYTENNLTSWETTSLENYSKTIENLTTKNYYGFVSQIRYDNSDYVNDWEVFGIGDPLVPVLYSPSNGVSLEDDNTPDFEWTLGLHSSHHRLVVATNSGFTENVVDVDITVPENTHTTELENGLYYWKVINMWAVEDSETWSFMIGNQLPSIENLYITDADNVAIANLIPQTQYKFWVEIQDNDNLSDVENVTLVIYLDNENLPDAEENHYTFQWTRDNGFEEVGPKENANFGFEEKGENIFIAPDNVPRGTWFTCIESGEPKSITQYFKAHFSARPHIKCAIYRKDNFGLVAYTEEWQLTTGWDNWKTLNIIWVKENLVAGENYWLFHWHDADVKIYYDIDVDNITCYKDYIYYDGWPDPMVTPTAYNYYKYSIYCTLETSPHLIIENCETGDDSLTTDNIVFAIQLGEDAQVAENWDVWVQVYDSVGNQDNRFFLDRFDVVSAAEWNLIETWTGAAEAPAAWILIDTWTGTVEAFAQWDLIETWDGVIGVQAPAEWQLVETWTGTVEAPVEWSLIEQWSGTVRSPSAWSLVESWGGVVEAPAEWSLIEEWSGTLQAPTAWVLIEEWGGAVQAPAAWGLIESWDGTVEAPTAWVLIETWTGTINAPAEWNLIEQWSGTVQTPTIWTLIETWTGTVEAPAEWQLIETWSGTVETIAEWTLIETWGGTVNAPVAWVLIETWSGNVEAFSGWLLIETWSGALESFVGWQEIETWTGTMEAPAEWQLIESWEGTIRTPSVPVWHLIETWAGAVETLAEWNLIETWTGNIQAPVEWLLVETWAGTIEAPSAWQLVEAWSGTVEAFAEWNLIESWVGAVESQAEWALVETWSGDMRAPAAWQLIESWSGAIKVPAGWWLIGTWTGTVEAYAEWQLVGTWTGAVETHAQWSLIETWEGTVIAPVAWELVETWNGTITAPTAWQLVETWAGTIQTPTAWSLVESWSGSVQTQAGWSEVESWAGTVYAIGWKLIETWEGTVRAPAFILIETWGGSIETPAVYAVTVSITPENQSGTLGGTLTYTVIVFNIGAQPDTYDLTASDSQGWTVYLDDASVGPVASGDNENTTLNVGLTTIGTHTVTVTATSQADGTVSHTDNCTAVSNAAGALVGEGDTALGLAVMAVGLAICLPFVLLMIRRRRVGG